MKTLLLALLLASPAAAAVTSTVRSIHEGVCSTGNSLYVSSVAVAVGVGNCAPATTLDVTGSASFGSVAAKSTFTTTGALNLNSGSALVLSGSGATTVGGSSITASAFFGDGSNLSFTNVTSSKNFAAVNGFTSTYGVAGGTLTATVGTSKVRVCFSGTGVHLLADSSTCYINFLVDSNYVDTTKKQSGYVFGAFANQSGGTAPLTICQPLSGLSLASHTFAIMVRNSAGLSSCGVAAADSNLHNIIWIEQTP